MTSNPYLHPHFETSVMRDRRRAREEVRRMLDRFERERAVLATRRVLETVQLSGS